MKPKIRYVVVVLCKNKVQMTLDYCYKKDCLRCSDALTTVMNVDDVRCFRWDDYIKSEYFFER